MLARKKAKRDSLGSWKRLHRRFIINPSRVTPSMAKSTDEETANRGGEADENDEEDYMSDLSKFIPLEQSQSKKSKKLPGDTKTICSQPSRKKTKTTQNWQEQRRQEKERKQLEEDQQTLASLHSAIPQSNIGFKLLQQMGYKPGSSLGKDGSGRAEPIGLDIRRSRAGIGRDDPLKEKMEKDKQKAEIFQRTKRKEEELMVEFGSRQKSQWRSRRVVVNFEKAKAALDQLENREPVLEPNKEDDNEERQDNEEEQEEEVVTEEDLLEILMKLRDEHHYCLFCGCQYNSTEDLLSSCPGVDEDDH